MLKIQEDATSATKSNLRFLGKGNHSNYDCHYVPVVNYGDVDYRPPKSGKHELG